MLLAFDLAQSMAPLIHVATPEMLAIANTRQPTTVQFIPECT